jgi:[ribosomal protein S5]-alanine N-acetyltransferase
MPRTGPKQRLLTKRLQLLAPSLVLAESTRDFQLRNADHLAPWSPPMPTGWTRLSSQQRQLDHARTAWESGSALRWWLSPRRGDGSELIGSIAFSQIARGPFQSAMLGYQLDAGCEGRGQMHEALQAALAEVFSRRVMLHRVQANVRPENERSLKLLQRLGFGIEGLAPQYLFIDGAWCDHLMTALLNPAFTDPPPLG